jgi:CheY-like chemotaxis protein
MYGYPLQFALGDLNNVGGLLVSGYPLFHPGSYFCPVWNPALAADNRSKHRDGRAKPSSGKSDAIAGANRNRVLMLGRVRELALYRAEVLRNKGFQVEISLNDEHALELIRNANYDAVVVSYTLPDNVVRQLADEMRESCPQCPVVAIANTRVPDRTIRPDRIVLADEGPVALIRALRQVLNTH